MSQGIDETKIFKQLSQELKVNETIARKVIEMIDEGNTVPFIARYRKEATGGLDEVAIKDLTDRWQYLKNIAERKEEIIRLITEQEKMTPELMSKINQAT